MCTADIKAYSKLLQGILYQLLIFLKSNQIDIYAQSIAILKMFFHSLKMTK